MLNMIMPDIERCINAHIEVRQRVINYTYGTPTYKIDSNSIRSDRDCELGKWIYSDASIRHSRSVWYQHLTAYHAAFHVVAAAIVDLVNEGDIDAAKERCEGMLDQVSANVLACLMEIKEISL